MGSQRTVGAQSEAGRRRRDQAITACCLAAAAVDDRRLDRSRRGRILMECLGLLSAAHSVGSAPSMTDFRQGLTGPLGHLLPGDVSAPDLADRVLLDSSGHLRDEALDLCAEHLVPSVVGGDEWSLAKITAELEERRVYDTLRRLSNDDYTVARELLIDRAAGELRDIRRAWDTLWGRFDGYYESISEWSWCHVGDSWFACPICHWPMRVTGGGMVMNVRCEAHAGEGVSYTCDDPGSARVTAQLQPVGRTAAVVEANPATRNWMAVSRTVWRYVTLPGVLERELRDYARDILKVDVCMYPHKDVYDLKITANDHVWHVDAKAWASPVALGESLQEKAPPVRPLVIVIPDRQESSRELLQEMLGSRGYRVLTSTGLKAEIARVVRGGR